MHQRFNNFIMDYNRFAYYRANPYAAKGFMPPTAFINRHSNEFAVQMPQGEEHLAKIGKRMFYQHHLSSNIQDQHLLESPERYPYENRIALDKKYQRNMNTIDIEGASSGTLKTEAVRNKFRGREALIQRQKELNGKSELEQLELLERTEEDRRKQIAYQQYLKNQKLNKLISKKASTKYDEEIQRQQEQYPISSRLKQEIRGNSLPQRRENTPKRESRDYRDYRQESSMDRALQYHHESNGGVRKQMYQSIDVGRIPVNPELGFDRNKKGDEVISLAESQRIPSSEEYRIPLVIDKKSLRKQNPTNLSSISTMNGRY